MECHPEGYVAAVSRSATGGQRATHSVPDVDIALADAVLTGSPPRFQRWLAPAPRNLAAARRLVDHACRSWGIGDVSEAAQLVVTELASNVIRHAGTDMLVDVALRGRYLHVAVRDRSSLPARLVGPAGDHADSGRGLIVVAALTASWGCIPTPDGKTVWARLRLPADDPAGV